jgi:hypothetical protein
VGTLPVATGSTVVTTAVVAAVAPGRTLVTGTVVTRSVVGPEAVDIDGAAVASGSGDEVPPLHPTQSAPISTTAH